MQMLTTGKPSTTTIETAVSEMVCRHCGRGVRPELTVQVSTIYPGTIVGRLGLRERVASCPVCHKIMSVKQLAGGIEGTNRCALGAGSPL